MTVGWRCCQPGLALWGRKAGADVGSQRLSIECPWPPSHMPAAASLVSNTSRTSLEKCGVSASVCVGHHRIITLEGTTRSLSPTPAIAGCSGLNIPNRWPSSICSKTSKSGKSTTFQDRLCHCQTVVLLVDTEQKFFVWCEPYLWSPWAIPGSQRYPVVSSLGWPAPLPSNPDSEACLEQ